MRSIRKLDQNSEEKFKAYEEQIQTAKIKALSEKEGIKTEGLEAGKKLIEGVKEEADKVMQQAMERIEKEATMAREALRRQTEDMAQQIAEKLLGRSLQ